MREWTRVGKGRSVRSFKTVVKENVGSITSKSIAYMKWNIIQPQKERKLLLLVATQNDKHPPYVLRCGN